MAAVPIQEELATPSLVGPMVLVSMWVRGQVLEDLAAGVSLVVRVPAIGDPSGAPEELAGAAGKALG